MSQNVGYEVKILVYRVRCSQNCQNFRFFDFLVKQLVKILVFKVEMWQKVGYKVTILVLKLILS